LTQYRPRISIYTPTGALRWPMAWTPMALHEMRDGKKVSGQNATKMLGWRAGRKYIKRLQTGAYGTWCVIRTKHRLRVHW